MADRDPQRNRRAHRDAADDKSLDAAPVGEGQHVFGERGDRIALGIAGRRSALAAAFERQPAKPVAVGKHFGHLRLVAAEPVLEDDRQPGAFVAALQGDAATLRA